MESRRHKCEGMWFAQGHWLVTGRPTLLSPSFTEVQPVWSLISSLQRPSFQWTQGLGTRCSFCLECCSRYSWCGWIVFILEIWAEMPSLLSSLSKVVPSCYIFDFCRRLTSVWNYLNYCLLIWFLCASTEYKLIKREALTGLGVHVSPVPSVWCLVGTQTIFVEGILDMALGPGAAKVNKVSLFFGDLIVWSERQAISNQCIVLCNICKVPMGTQRRARLLCLEAG